MLTSNSVLLNEGHASAMVYEFLMSKAMNVSAGIMPRFLFFLSSHKVDMCLVYTIVYLSMERVALSNV